MANNCLVTKLKTNVQNDSLIKVNHFRVKFVEGGSVILKSYLGDGNVHYESINNDSVNRDMHNTDNNPINNIPAGTILDVSPKYNICSLNGNFDMDLEDLKYSPIMYIHTPACTTIKGDISNLNYPIPVAVGAGFTHINIRGCSNIFGDIASIATKIAAIGVSEEINVAATSITGDLASLLNANVIAHEINIIGSGITTTQATLDAFAARNIQIDYTQDQVVG